MNVYCILFFFICQLSYLGFCDSMRVIYVGAQTTLTFHHSIKNFSIGSNHISAIPSPHPHASHSLLIKGVKPGISNLCVWQKDHQKKCIVIHVQKELKLEFPDSLLAGIEKINYIHYELIGPKKLLITGEITSLEEGSRVFHFIQEHSSYIIDQTTLGEHLLSHIVQQLEAHITKHFQSNTSLAIKKDGRHLFLIGTASSKLEHESIIKGMQNIYPLLDISQFECSNIVVLKIFILEIDSHFSKSLGLELRSADQGLFSASWSATPQPYHSAPFKISDFQMTLHALEQQGHGQILSNPQVTVKLPGTAELFSGGQIPITLRTRSQQKVDWERYGLSLKVTLDAKSARALSMDISTELSELDLTTPSPQGIPGIKVNKLQTQVESFYDHPVVLAGLMHKKEKKTLHGIPFLCDIPFIGRLFSTEKIHYQTSELMIVLIPSRTPDPLPQKLS